MLEDFFCILTVNEVPRFSERNQGKWTSFFGMNPIHIYKWWSLPTSNPIQRACFNWDFRRLVASSP